MSKLSSLISQINTYEIKHTRPPNSVKLLAVSKTQEASKILSLYQEGQRCFGESYVQEALKKIALLPSDIEWHFIGPIQSNKTRKIAEYFSWVESVSSEKQLIRLNEQRPIHLPPLNICLEVNIDAEADKSGSRPDEVLPLARFAQTLPKIKFRGLMCIPKESDDININRAAFKKLRLLMETLNQENFLLDTLSMGMTHDFEAAIAEGSTQVRIGRGLFGERNMSSRKSPPGDYPGSI